MKKVVRNRSLLVASLFLLFLIGFFSVKSSAWVNTHSTGTKGVWTYAQSVGAYQTAYYTSGDEPRPYYGTHDWIAEMAIKIMKDHPVTHTFVDMLYFDQDLLKMYYLLGNEAPDVRHSISKNIVLTGCDGENYGDADIPKSGHNLHFTVVGDSKVLDGGLGPGAAARAQASAIQAFMEHDCRKAAFFLGAMVHLIADSASYCHLFREAEVNSSLIGHKNSWETKIGKLTWKVDRNFLLNGYNFFSIDAALSYYASEFLMKYSAWTAAYHAGYFTDDHKWTLWNTFVEHPDYFPSINSELYDWNRATFNGLESPQRDYFELIELCLNKAIFYSAMAISDTLQYYDGCDCNGERKEHQDILDSLDRTTDVSSQILPYFLVTGVSSVFLSLGVKFIFKFKGR